MRSALWPSTFDPRPSTCPPRPSTSTMTISRLDEQTLTLSELDLLAVELLHQIGISAEPEGSPAAAERLFPSPSAGRDSSLDRDWKNYVEPGLRELFQSSLEIIETDLADFPGQSSEDTYSLDLPVKHLEAWIHGLNQARLALAARYSFTEEEMEGRIPLEGDTRAFALFQVHFYGFLQECFLRELGDQ